MQLMNKVAIIGGGAAGLMAAITASKSIFFILESHLQIPKNDPQFKIS